MPILEFYIFFSEFVFSLVSHRYFCVGTSSRKYYYCRRSIEQRQCLIGDRHACGVQSEFKEIYIKINFLFLYIARMYKDSCQLNRSLTKHVARSPTRHAGLLRRMSRSPRVSDNNKMFGNSTTFPLIFNFTTNENI